MKRKISKIFALTLTAIFIIAACGACNEGTTEGSQPQNSGTQGSFGVESTAQDSIGGSTDDNLAQDVTVNGTEQSSGQNSNEGDTGSGFGTVTGEKATGLEVVIYSNTKADFIIDNAYIAPGSGDICQVLFSAADMGFTVRLENSGDNYICFIDGPQGDTGKCAYSYEGNQLILSADMSEWEKSDFNFNEVTGYVLEYFVDWKYAAGPTQYAAADVVRGKRPEDMNIGLQVMVYNESNVDFIIDNLNMNSEIPETFRIVFDTENGRYCVDMLSYGYCTLYRSKNADNKELEDLDRTLFSCSYKQNENGLIIELNMTKLGFNVDKVEKFTLQYIRCDEEKIVYEKIFAASDVLCSHPDCFKYTGDGNGGIIITKIDLPQGVLRKVESLIYIPSEIDGKPVTTIGDGNGGVFLHSFKKVVIPDSVTKISKSAFGGCNIEGWLTISENVTEIGENAFHSCENLTGLTISGGKAVIGSYAFYKCGLVDVDIDVKTIGDHAFYVNDNLESVNIKAETIGEEAFANVFTDNPSERRSFGSVISAETIGKRAFEYSGIKDLTFMDGVREIGEEAFKDCRLLTDFTFPDSVTVLGSGAFSYCHSLTNVIYPKNITVINDAFYRCLSVVSVTFPQTVTEIGDGAFGWWRSITDIRIPDGCTSIGTDAFYTCDSLSSVYVPDSVKEIGHGAFYSCTKLKTITLPKGVKLEGGENSVFRFSPTKVTYR